MAAKRITRAQVEDKLTIWQQRLDLLDWDIRIDFGEQPEGEDAVMEIHVHSQYDRAVLLLRADWKKWPVDGVIDQAVLGGDVSLDYLLCHELLHALMRDLDHLLLVDVEDQMHRDAHDVASKGYLRHREHVVDRMARSLVDGWGFA
jgi:hypothetical protein